MTLATAFLAAALFVPSMPPPEYDDCEVVTNCVFDASRDDAKMFTVRVELDATPSNGVEVVFGRDADGDGILSRTEEVTAIGIKYEVVGKAAEEELGENIVSDETIRLTVFARF